MERVISNIAGPMSGAGRCRGRCRAAGGGPKILGGATLLGPEVAPIRTDPTAVLWRDLRRT